MSNESNGYPDAIALGGDKPDVFAYFERATAVAALILSEQGFLKDGKLIKRPKNTVVPPLTIGVFAEWGRGKTTLIETVRSHLESSGQFVVLRYRPWLYRLNSFEDVWLSMIDDFSDQVATWDGVLKGAFSDGTAISSLLRKLGLFTLRGVDIARLLLPTLLAPSPEVGPVVETLKELTDAFRQVLVDKPQAAHSFLARGKRAIQSLCSQAKAKTGVLLIVDDLDRCEPGIAVEILRALHVFARTDNLVCLVGMDRDVVVSSLLSRYGTVPHANEYLHKIFQLSVTPPRVSRGIKGNVVALLKGSGRKPTHQTVWTRFKFKGDISNHDLAEFCVRWLAYNPRMLERFRLLYRFREEVWKLENAGKATHQSLPTAAQCVIELRWPEWNWVAYRLPDAESAFKAFVGNPSAEPEEVLDRDELLARYPVLERFVANHDLCRFYREYYSLK